jgi:hypothetical protein
MDLDVRVARHPYAGEDEERSEDVDDEMECVEQRGACRYEHAAQDDRPDDPPVDDASLIGGRDGEVREDQREHEQVVDRE